jgi:hypothetical protein
MGGNASYSAVNPGSLADTLGDYQRRKIFAAFMKFVAPDPTRTILDVGVASDSTYLGSNYLEALYPDKSKITAVGVEDASFLQRLYPGLRFLRANGFDLPFSNDSFDIVHASAVLEHVGDRDRQIRFLRELWRVARSSVFVTTPNRWFPIEFHTVLPILHWLPMSIYQKIPSLPGQGLFSQGGESEPAFKAEPRGRSAWLRPPTHRDSHCALAGMGY